MSVSFSKISKDRFTWFLGLAIDGRMLFAVVKIRKDQLDMFSPVGR